MQRIQKQGETVEGYANALCGLLRLGYPEMAVRERERLGMEVFIKGLLTDYQKWVRLNSPAYFDGALQMAKRCEMFGSVGLSTSDASKAREGKAVSAVLTGAFNALDKLNDDVGKLKTATQATALRTVAQVNRFSSGNPVDQTAPTGLYRRVDDLENWLSDIIRMLASNDRYRRLYGTQRPLARNPTSRWTTDGWPIL